MKKYLAAILFLSGIIFVSAAGCGGTPAQEETDSAREQEETGGAQAQKEEAQGGTENARTEEAISSLSEEAKSAYHSVLYDIYFNHLFPDEKSYGFLADADISENEFAICDVDQDGSQELLITYTTTDEAGKTEFIYDFVSALDTVREEFLEYPLLTFYDNGYIEAGWSQNQGLSGADFQPYTLYQYDSGSDTYVAAAQVDAWERSVSETDEEGNGFPEEIDAGGAGIVYYITPDGEEPGEPVDQAEYEAWTASWRGEAREMEIPWMKLTEENINMLKR